MNRTALLSAPALFYAASGKQIFDSLLIMSRFFAHTSLHLPPFFLLGSSKFRKIKRREIAVSKLKFCQWIFVKKKDKMVKMSPL
jgi:hypothetical protein